MDRRAENLGKAIALATLVTASGSVISEGIQKVVHAPSFPVARQLSSSQLSSERALVGLLRGEGVEAAGVCDLQITSMYEGTDTATKGRKYLLEEKVDKTIVSKIVIINDRGYGYDEAQGNPEHTIIEFQSNTNSNSVDFAETDLKNGSQGHWQAPCYSIAEGKKAPVLALKVSPATGEKPSSGPTVAVPLGKVAETNQQTPGPNYTPHTEVTPNLNTGLYNPDATSTVTATTAVKSLTETPTVTKTATLITTVTPTESATATGTRKIDSHPSQGGWNPIGFFSGLPSDTIGTLGITNWDFLNSPIMPGVPIKNRNIIDLFGIGIDIEDLTFAGLSGTLIRRIGSLPLDLVRPSTLPRLILQIGEIMPFVPIVRGGSRFAVRGVNRGIDGVRDRVGRRVGNPAIPNSERIF